MSAIKCFPSIKESPLLLHLRFPHVFMFLSQKTHSKSAVSSALKSLTLSEKFDVEWLCVWILLHLLLDGNANLLLDILPVRGYDIKLPTGIDPITQGHYHHTEMLLANVQR